MTEQSNQPITSGRSRVIVEGNDNSDVNILRLVFKPHCGTAFFTLRLRLTSQPDFVYLLISPEQINSLTMEDCTEPRFVKACRSPGGMFRLQFILEKPALLVGPRTWQVDVNAPTSSDILSLTTRTTLAIHIPHDAFPKAQL